MAAANWGLIETLLNVKRRTGENESFVEFVVTEERVQWLKDTHGFDLAEARRIGNRGWVRESPRRLLEHALPA